MFNQTIYRIFEGKADPPNYLHFVGWTYLWAAIFHWVAALSNGVSRSYIESNVVLITSLAVRGLKYVTRFSCDTFGFYVSAVYVQYGIQTVTRQFHQSSTPAAFLGIM